MRALERISLIDKIGRSLQSRMTFAEIDQYFKANGIDLSKPSTGRNSKWVYSKEMLEGVPESLLIRIADELEIDYELSTGSSSNFSDSRFWTPGFFKLFISHVSSEKTKATALKNALKNYAISGFVAHEDIHPTLEWQNEIEKALFSMDALAACLTPTFHESKWTDQEIGYALGRNCLVIPIRIGLDPYGFLGKVQGIQAKGKKPSEIALLIFSSICENIATRSKMSNVIVDQIITNNNPDDAIKFIILINTISNFPIASLERLRDNVSSNTAISKHTKFINKLNDLLAGNGLDKYTFSNEKPAEVVDIPF